MILITSIIGRNDIKDILWDWETYEIDILNGKYLISLVNIMWVI